MYFKKILSVCLCLIMASLCLVAPAFAAETIPSNEIVLIRDFNPGGHAVVYKQTKTAYAQALADENGTPIAFSSNPLTLGAKYRIEATDDVDPIYSFREGYGKVGDKNKFGRTFEQVNEFEDWTYAPLHVTYRLTGSRYANGDDASAIAAATQAGLDLAGDLNGVVYMDGYLVSPQLGVYDAMFHLEEVCDSAIRINDGETADLYVEVRGDRCPSARISVRDTSIATYADGKLTALKAGATTIRVAIPNYENNQEVGETVKFFDLSVSSGDEINDTPSSTTSSPFQKIIEFLRKIIDFFKNLFK